MPQPPATDQWDRPVFHGAGPKNNVAAKGRGFVLPDELQRWTKKKVVEGLSLAKRLAGTEGTPRCFRACGGR